MPTVSANVFLPPGEVTLMSLKGSVRGHSVYLSPGIPESCTTYGPTTSGPTTMVFSEFRIYSDFSLYLPLSIPWDKT